MKRKKNEKVQTVRVEVVANNNSTTPSNSTAIVTQASQVPSMMDSAEVALEMAKRQMHYRSQLLKLIAAQVNKNDVYAYETSTTCTKCGGPVKPSFSSSDGYYCRKDGQIGKNVTRVLEPYLSGAACRFVLRSAGVKFEEPRKEEIRYSGTDGDYLDIEIWVTVTPRDGIPVTTFGNCPTNDDFFAKRFRYVCPNCASVTMYKDGKSICSTHGEVRSKREPYYLSLEEVDVSGIKQKAMTNAWNHAVRDLGLMPSKEHFADAGVDLSTCRRVSFGRSNQDDDDASSPAVASKNEKPAPGQGGGTGRAAAPSQEQPKAQPAAKEDPSARPARSESAPEGTNTQEPTSSVPQARIPRKITDAKWNKKKGMSFQVDGAAWICVFDNKKFVIDKKEVELFDLLINAQGQLAIFETKVQKTTEGTKYNVMTKLLQLGDREWDEQGIPVIRREPGRNQMREEKRMREPGEEG